MAAQHEPRADRAPLASSRKGRPRAYAGWTRLYLAKWPPKTASSAILLAMGRGKSPAESMATALVELRRADHNDREGLAAAVDEATRNLAEAVEDLTYSKTEAARLLGVSLQTLDTWISRNLLPVVRVRNYKRDRVPAAKLVDVAAEINELREMGRTRGLLAAAIARLEEDEPDSGIRDLSRRAARPFDRSKYVPAIPEGWDPKD